MKTAKKISASFGGVTLHVNDIGKSLEFYSNLPGAKVVVPIQGTGKNRFAMVQLGEGTIGLLTGVPQMSFHLEIEATDLDGTYEELNARGYRTEGPPEDRPWGQRDMRLMDPDGYMVEFDQAK